jgi:hypothetical protein
LERSGGISEDGVAAESWSVDDNDAEPLEDWVRELVQDQD